MYCKLINCKIAMTLFIAICFLITHAQNDIDCQKAGQFLPNLEHKICKISIDDPELISLHYLFVEDMESELAHFRQKTIPKLHRCPEMDFYQTLRQCDTLENRLALLHDTLQILRQRVDKIFYNNALEELYHRDTTLCMYLLDRSIQFNRLHTDALILKMKLLFAQKEYDECIRFIHLLYNEAPLDNEHEHELSDFTAIFYDKLFSLGDSLVKIEHATEALSIFETLETFCQDMPTNYCNDDYYYGIIRSKTGVYESYLTIAKVAWEKHNDEIAYKFLDYAEQYLAENKDNVTLHENFVHFKQKLTEQRTQKAEPPEEPQQNLKTPAQPSHSEKTYSSDNKDDKNKINIDKKKQEEYNKLLKEAIQCCKNNKFDEAWDKLKRAKSLENCHCITPDFRVQVLYDELHQYYQ